MVDAEVEPTIQKTHGLSTTPFVKVLMGYLSVLTTCERLTESLPKLSLISLVPDPHTAVEEIGLAVLVRGASSITQDVGAGEVEVHFPLPGRFGYSRPMRLV